MLGLLASVWDREGVDERAAVQRRGQEDTLQSYLDRIGQLVTGKDLRNERHTNNFWLRACAQTVLGGIDGRRKRNVSSGSYGRR
jgi:hypothetical protein